MSKYKYYSRKPRGEIVKDILTWLAVGGVIAIAAASPYFGAHLVQSFLKGKKHKPKSTENAFRRLFRQGYIVIHKSNHQIYLSLTEAGRKKAGIYQLNDLEIKKPIRWDGKWRIAIFDIPDSNRFAREALRGFLKRLEFFQLQKSVWVHAFDCKDEIALLSSLFGFNEQQLRLIVTGDVGDDTLLKKKCHISES